MSDFLSHLVTRSLVLAPKAAAPIVRPRVPSRFESRLDPVGFDLETMAEETTEGAVAAKAPSNALPQAEPRDLLRRREPRSDSLPSPAPPSESSRSVQLLPAGPKREEPESVQRTPKSSLRPPRREDDEVLIPRNETARSVEPAKGPSPAATAPPRQTSPRFEPTNQRTEVRRTLEPEPPQAAPPPSAPARQDPVKVASEPAPARTLLQPRVERIETEPFPGLRNEPTAEPVIQVTIGRVEVRATPASKPRARERAAASPAVDLEEYLRQRAQGDRR